MTAFTPFFLITGENYIEPKGLRWNLNFEANSQNMVKLAIPIIKLNRSLVIDGVLARRKNSQISISLASEKMILKKPADRFRS